MTIQRYSAEAVADDSPELRATVRAGIEAALERGDAVRVGIEGEVDPPTGLCGGAVGASGSCVFLPHRLGTPHSWTPPAPTQRPGETILDAERRERRATR